MLRKHAESSINANLAAVSIVVLFLMLWVPLGQFAFMTQHWMKVGTFAAAFMLIAYFATASRRPEMSDPAFMSIVLLAVYVAHQFEEHWIDLFGNQYAFYDYVNALVRRVIDSGDPSVVALTPSAIYVINTSLVWLVGLIAVARSGRHLFPVLALAGITLVNGVTHVLAGLINLSYNPGLLTSVVLFLPLSVAFYRLLLEQRPAMKYQAFVSIVWAILAHVLMVAGMLAAKVFGVIPETVYFGSLVAWSLLPLAICRSGH